MNEQETEEILKSLGQLGLKLTIKSINIDFIDETKDGFSVAVSAYIRVTHLNTGAFHEVTKFSAITY